MYDRLQCIAVLKSFHADASYALEDGDGGQPATAAKGGSDNAGNVVCHAIVGDFSLSGKLHYR